MFKSPFSAITPENLQNIADNASKLLPNEKSREELHRSIQLLVQNALSKLDLVTREEFDAQAAVLQKTRAKAEQLEVQLSELEKKISNN